MRIIARVRSLLRSLIHRRHVEAGMNDELRFHLEQRTGDLIRAGLPETDARRQACTELGSIPARQDECREALGLRFVDELRSDLRYTVRGLCRTPAFSLGAIAILAVGIGLNTAVITLINAAFFQGFRSVAGNDRILYVYSQNNGQYSGVSYPDFEDWRAEVRSLTGLAAVEDLKAILNSGDGVQQRRTITRITTNGFRLIGAAPVVGRDFQEADAAPGAPAVAILTYGFWDQSFGKDPAIIGRQLHMDGQAPITVIGVMPRGFSFPQNQDLWIPLRETPDLQRRDARNLWLAFGRMAEGISRERVQTELDTIGSRLAAAYPATNQGQRPKADTFSEYFIGSKASFIFTALWLAGSFVLLVACANLANLMLARAIRRSREISIHLALGAGGWRILRRALLESLVLTAIGAFCGWFLARAGIGAYEVLVSPPSSEWNYGLLTYTMDYGVLAHFVAISIVAAIFFGVVPALRVFSIDPNSMLKSGSRGVTGSAPRRRLSGALVVTQVALAAALLSGAAVMLRSFLAVETAPLGVDLNHTVSFLLHLPDDKYQDLGTRHDLMERIKTRLETIPGIESASIGTVPAGGLPAHVPYEIVGSEPSNERSRPSIVAASIGSGYFRTLGARVLSGRDFSAKDNESQTGVAIINQRFAEQQWPGQNPLGQRLRLFSGSRPQPWLTIVGIASNIVYDRTRQEVAPVVYVYYGQSSGDPWVLARSSIPAGNLNMPLRQELGAVDPGVVLWLGPFDLKERLATGGIYGNIRSHALLLVVFAVSALLLSVVGLSTVSAYSVSRRTQELGIRIAVGATSRDILKLVMKEGMLQVIFGLTIGLLLSFGVNRVLQSELVHVSPSDPVALAVASGALVLAAVIGSLIPARRALRVDPTVALRQE